MTHLLLLELGLDHWPSLGLGGIRQEVHDDGTSGDGLVNLEKVLSWYPSILNGLLPRLTILSDTNDDVEAVITEVKTLTVTLTNLSVLK